MDINIASVVQTIDSFPLINKWYVCNMWFGFDLQMLVFLLSDPLTSIKMTNDSQRNIPGDFDCEDENLNRCNDPKAKMLEKSRMVTRKRGIDLREET